MEAWNVVIAVVLAIATGAALPVLVEARGALRAVRRAAERIDRVTAKLEEGGRLRDVLAAIDSVSRAARHVGDATRAASVLGAAIAPAAAAAVQAWTASGEGRAASERRDGAPEPIREGGEEESR